MYTIKRTTNRKITMWDKEWDKAETANVTTVNWAEFDYAPNTTAKLLYNDYGIYVQMQTDEESLLARCTEQNGHVSLDSCMEFFFRPNENDARYLNFEFNPFTTMYLGCRTDRYDFINPEVSRDYFEPQSHVQSGRWVLQYFIPFAFIDGIFGSHSDKMLGNFYKCGVDTKIQHFCTYYPIDTPKPDFHRPDFFGEFVFE